MAYPFRKFSMGTHIARSGSLGLSSLYPGEPLLLTTNSGLATLPCEHENIDIIEDDPDSNVSGCKICEDCDEVVEWWSEYTEDEAF
mgnify:CR=1 FL=1|tara:strand:- start:18 stop:275 length:258 start_codon:yes stop_codon:yes gene_type:complete